MLISAMRNANRMQQHIVFMHRDHDHVYYSCYDLSMCCRLHLQLCQEFSMRTWFYTACAVCNTEHAAPCHGKVQGVRLSSCNALLLPSNIIALLCLYMTLRHLFLDVVSTCTWHFAYGCNRWDLWHPVTSFHPQIFYHIIHTCLESNFQNSVLWVMSVGVKLGHGNISCPLCVPQVLCCNPHSQRDIQNQGQ